MLARGAKDKEHAMSQKLNTAIANELGLEGEGQALI
jgi:hypothetical protein